MTAGALAGILLTGGPSSRLGRDKAALPLGPGGSPLAVHLGGMLKSVVAFALEVGPGRSGLPLTTTTDPATGPLAAVALARTELASSGWTGPALVLATDLPRLSLRLLRTLARWGAPASTSVLPLLDARPQYLCARWSAAALERGVSLVDSGERRVQAAFDEGEVLFLGEGELSSFDLATELADLDDEAAAAALGLELPPRR